MSTTSPARRETRRLPLAERRTRMVVARLTETEGDLVEASASARGVSVSDLLREALLAATASTSAVWHGRGPARQRRASRTAIVPRPATTADQGRP